MHLQPPCSCRALGGALWTVSKLLFPCAHAGQYLLDYTALIGANIVPEMCNIIANNDRAEFFNVNPGVPLGVDSLPILSGWKAVSS